MFLRIFRPFLVLIVAAVTIPLLFLLWMTLADYRPPAREALGDTGGKALNDTVLRFMTWNIGYAGLGREMDFFYDGGKRTRAYPEYYRKYKQGIIRHIREKKDIDIILLQEVDRGSTRSYFDDQLKWLDSTLNRRYHYFAWNYRVGYVPVPLLRPLGKVRSGMVTFSKYEAAKAERIGFEGNYSWPLRLFMLDRCYILNRFPLTGREGKELVVINTHNSAFDDGTLRLQQLEQLTEIMVEEYEKGNYVVAGGDWNINPPGFHPGLVKTGDWADLAHGAFMSENDLPPGWKWVRDPTVPTNRLLIEPYWKSRTPVTVIDFFIVSPNVNVLDVKTEDLGFENSDHNPVVMSVRLAD